MRREGDVRKDDYPMIQDIVVPGPTRRDFQWCPRQRPDDFMRHLLGCLSRLQKVFSGTIPAKSGTSCSLRVARVLGRGFLRR